MLLWKVVFVLVCGNIVVFKFVECMFLFVMFFGNLVKEVGFLLGVVNIILGLGYVVGKVFVEYMDVDKIVFIGSIVIGKVIMRLVVFNLKNIIFECGGKNLSIVFDDVEFDQVVKWCYFGIMENQGQVCILILWIYV